jgi:hypothetical protein
MKKTLDFVKIKKIALHLFDGFSLLMYTSPPNWIGIVSLIFSHFFVLKKIKVSAPKRDRLKYRKMLHPLY